MKFGTLIVDPPWEYVERGVLEHTGGRPYPMLTNDDLAALPIADWVTEDASMFLWTTGVFLPNAFQLIDAWGWQYKTVLYWVKTQKDMTKASYGVGYHFRGCVEPIIFAQRRRAKMIRTNYIGLLGPTLGHSRKPDSLYEIAELYPGPKFELFA